MQRLTLIATLCVSIGSAYGQSSPDYSITVYSLGRPAAAVPQPYRPGVPAPQAVPDGYAMVRQEQTLDIPQPDSELRIRDVAAQIDPTTVAFESITDPEGTHVVEQSYEFDLVSPAKLLARYIDRRITIEQIDGDRRELINGTLLSTQGGIVLQDDGGEVQILEHYARARLPELPGGLITRPTLVWALATAQPGSHRVRISYQTRGLTWWADYNMTLHEAAEDADCRIDVGAWVTLVNRSGATYPDTRLKLVAGDVHRAPEPQPMLPRVLQAEAVQAAPPGFAEKAFFEYHLYTLGRTTSLPDNSTKQIELFPAARNVECERTLVYHGTPGARGFFPDPITDRAYGLAGNRKVDVYLRLENTAASGLGMPLPAGRVRVNQLDPADNSLEFIGEDAIDHTPRDESVEIELGSAFDVVGERKQRSFQVDTARKWMQEEIEVRLRNRKERAVKVVVKENLYRWTNWNITEHSHPYEKADSRTVDFPVSVPASGETVVRYTVRYDW